MCKNQHHYLAGQCKGTCWLTESIVYYRQIVPRKALTCNGSSKVLSVLAIEPSSAHDPRTFWVSSLYEQFTLEFRSPVHRQRVRGIISFVRRCLCSIEYVVSRNVHKWNVVLGCNLGHILCSCGVSKKCFIMM